MPMYSFGCWACAKYFEIIIKLEDYDKIQTEDGPKCPHCGRILVKLLDRPRFFIH